MTSALPSDQDPLGIFHHGYESVTSADGGAPGDGGVPGDQDPDLATGAHRDRLLLGVLAAVAALCCGGSAIIGALAASYTPSRKPAAIADGSVADSASPDPIPSDDPGQDRESGSTVRSSASPVGGIIRAPQPSTRHPATQSPSALGTRSPSPVPSVRGSLLGTTPPPASTRPPAPTSGPSMAVVHAGAFCSPAGAVGVTSTGTLMRCATTAADPKLRWRKA